MEIRRRQATEESEQMALFRWAEYERGRWPELDLLLHIPNGGYRGKTEAGRFKAMGVKSGVPDLFLPVARGPWHGLWIELKRTKGGRLSWMQVRWIARLYEQGYRAEVCWGWDEARQTIEAYLGGR
ncbi:MAG: VRR-NUC domain-containing protein [Clostridia bacterium]|nr:VRR-NUC domain-containing protein [Clostridia bacterium]